MTATTEKTVTRRKLALRAVVPMPKPAEVIVPALALAESVAALKEPKAGQGLKGRLQRLDEALVRLRKRLREDEALTQQIEAAVGVGATAQIRITLARKSNGGTKASLDIRALRAIAGHTIRMDESAQAEAANDPE